MNKVLLLLTILIFASCKEHNYLSYHKDKELINLDNFKTNNHDDFKSLGSYSLLGHPIAGKYNIMNKYSLSIIKLRAVKDSPAIKLYANNPLNENYYGSYNIINGSYYELSLMYNEDKLSSINEVEFYSDTDISASAVNAGLYEYQSFFGNFIIKFNKDTIGLLEGEAWSPKGEDKQTANFLFYVKDKTLYLFIMTPLISKEKMEPTSISDYLFSTDTLSNTNYINPQGTYILGGDKVEDDHGDVYGYNGHVIVKNLSSDKIVMNFFVCKGAPSYNFGSFTDTLDYKDNKAIYFDSSTSCQTTFTFNERSVMVKEADNQSMCWGYGVVAHGEFLKTSSKVPLIEEEY